MVKDASYWSEEIKKQTISPYELLKATTKKIQTCNPALNGIIQVEEEQALEMLKQRSLQQSNNLPFSGVPIPLKLLGQPKKGWLDSAGSRLFQHHRAVETSYFVKGLESCGFVPLAQSNTPEFGFKNITDPQLYGPSRNPWNKEFYSGGSSGGAATAVASGMFPIAAASDGGGSIRIPASFTGLIGLKPTRGSMPVGPTGFRSWQGASIHFALTVSMRDTKRLFDCMRVQQKAAPYLAPSYSKELKKNPAKKTIAYCANSPINSPVSKEAKATLKNSCLFLEKQGYKLIEIDYPLDGQRLMDSYYIMNAAETAAMMQEIELHLKRALTSDDMEAMTWGIYQYGKQLPASAYIQALNIWDEATVVMETLFESVDLFLSPTTAETAPKIGVDLQSDAIRYKLSQAHYLSKDELQQLVYEMFLPSLAITPYTQLANLTGQPAISLPIYVSKTGLPLGVQVMASKGREDLLFEIGELFEVNQQFCLPSIYQN